MDPSYFATGLTRRAILSKDVRHASQVSPHMKNAGDMISNYTRIW